jgi:NADPH:quinone reductase
MRAVVCREFTDYRNLKVETLPDPVLDDDGILIDIHAAGLTFATTLVVSGKYQRKPPRPFVPGLEAAGVIAALGKNAAANAPHLRPGDRVVASLDWGAFGGRARGHWSNVHLIPASMSFEEATSFAGSYPTAYGALVWRAKLQKDEWLLVHAAAGGVGIAAVEIGRHLGARVIATASNADKVAFVRERGAEHGIIVKDGSSFYEQVRAITGGHGADVVFDPAGGHVLLESLRCIAKEGRALTIGYAGGEIPRIPANTLLLKNCSVMGFNLGEYFGWGIVDERVKHAARMREMMAELMRIYELGALRPHVSARYALDDYVAGMDAMLDRRRVGKSVLVLSETDRNA